MADTPDYIPDVENPYKGSVWENKLPRPVKAYAKEWADEFPNPLVFSEAPAIFDTAVNFGREIIRLSCSGTCPPDSYLAPNLDKAIKDAAKIRDGMQALTDNGAGAGVWFANDDRYQKVKNYGLAVYLEAARYVGESAKEDAANRETVREVLDAPRQLVKPGLTFWKGALLLGLGIWTISTVKDLIATVKHRESA